MTKAVHTPAKKGPARTPYPAYRHGGKSVPGVSVRDLRAPVQILRSTKEWLDQIITEKNLRTYDEAIMFLITERQQHMPSDFGVFSDLEEYRCEGED